MLIKGFSLAESNNEAIQKRVCHVAEQAAACDTASPAAEARTDTHTASTKHKTKPVNNNQNIAHVVTPKKYHLTTQQANQERTQKMIEKQQFAKIFISATTVYAQQKKDK